MPTANRRDFVKGAVAGSLLSGAALPSVAAMTEKPKGAAPVEARPKPNIVLFVSDQFRWDFVGASQLNPTCRTPNIDKIAQRGVCFTHALTNQPLCSPARGCMMTGRYSTETGIWKLPPAGLHRDLPTLASVLRDNGYTANFIGKWHLAPSPKDDPKTLGFVHPEDRGGFLDFWEGANVLEMTSHPYQGTIWDGQGNPITFQDKYRVDFITDRAVRFLKRPQEKPFLLFISQLEPHYQNDMDRPVAPHGYGERYQNPYVPPDLVHLPGVWQSQLPDYYGCVESIDESVGTIVRTLEEQNLLDNTVFVFTSDHGCHFQTRENNYKRSPHDSSIRVPLLMQGPGLGSLQRFDQLVGNINLTPSLIDLAGVPVPTSMKGRSVVPLMRDARAQRDWRNQELIQISQTSGIGIGRAIRTAEWTYCVSNPTSDPDAPSTSSYSEYAMFNNFSDPEQMVNLAGRDSFKNQAAQLREQLLDLIVESGEAKPNIIPAHLWYP